jgi:hypothetical protein
VSEVYDFDLEAPPAFYFRHGGKDFILREPSGDALSQWRNAQGRGMKLEEEGRSTRTDGPADAGPLLLSLSTFEITDGGEKPVPLPAVRPWPGRMQKKLVEKALAMAGLLPPETAAEIEKQIAELQEKLAVARNGKLDEERAKN